MLSLKQRAKNLEKPVQRLQHFEYTHSFGHEFSPRTQHDSVLRRVTEASYAIYLWWPKKICRSRAAKSCTTEEYFSRLHYQFIMI